MKHRISLLVPIMVLSIRRILRLGRLTVAAFAMLFALIIWTGCKPKASTEKPGREEVVAQKVHLAFAGGGWRAHTGHAAWTMSLLDGGNKKLADVFANVGAVSSNSGGSWFSTMLMYSDKFIKAIEANNAINSWSTSGWLGQQQQLFDNSSYLTYPCDSLSGSKFVACVFAANTNDPGYWNEVVTNIVYNDYPIDKSVTLNTPHQAWAKDKPLLLAATLLTNEVVLTDTKIVGGFDLFYQACADPSVPILKGLKGAICSNALSTDVTPTTFASMPSGSTYKTPPFLSQITGAGQSVFNIAYKKNGSKKHPIDTTAHSTIENPLVNDKVPVVIAAATSSAAVGFAASEHISGSWTDSWGGEDEALSFQLAGSAVKFVDASDMTLQELASNKIVRLADGGAVDNSGVAQLVSFLQLNKQADGFNIIAFDNVQQAFTPAGGNGAVVGTDIAYLFGEGLTGGDKFCVQKYCVTVPDLRIFDLASLTGTLATWSATDTGAKPQMLIYTKYQVTTVDNAVFGIAAGTTGTLHAFTCVSPGSDTVPMNVTQDGDFIAYGKMVKFINSGLLANGGTGLKHLQAALNISR
jgi:hypothetical protein